MKTRSSEVLNKKISIEDGSNKEGVKFKRGLAKIEEFSQWL